MNVLLLIADTTRADYLGCHGHPWCETPNIDRLAARGALFSRFHTASFPTGPMRQDLLSGRFTFPYMPWSREWPWEHPTLPRELGALGYRTAMFADTPSNGWFGPEFDEFTIIQGQGHDMDPEGPKQRMPAKLSKLRGPMPRLQKILRNAAVRSGEEDTCAARTMRAARGWLEGRWRDQNPFFLMVDTFDPHEPWDPPRYYIDRYDPDYKGDELFEPAYEPADYASDDEIAHMRKMYAGELTMVDHWVGHLLDALDRMELWDDTLVIFTSDHGFYHGEHGLIGKVQLTRANRICKRWALYETISHAPLIVAGPGIEPGSRFSAFAQPPDILPTVLDLVGAEAPEPCQGMSLAPVLDGETTHTRDYAITSLTFCQDDHVRAPSSFRTADHLYIYGGDEWPHELYDLTTDPDESLNVIETQTDIAQAHHLAYLDCLRRLDCPPERLKERTPFMQPARNNLPKDRII